MQELNDARFHFSTRKGIYTTQATQQNTKRSTYQLSMPQRPNKMETRHTAQLNTEMTAERMQIVKIETRNRGNVIQSLHPRTTPQPESKQHSKSGSKVTNEQEKREGSIPLSPIRRSLMRQSQSALALAGGAAMGGASLGRESRVGRYVTRTENRPSF